MKRLVLILCLLATPLSAQTYVRDADTIEIDGQAWRLNGVNAAERGHPSFAAARTWMQQYLRGKYVECIWNGDVSGDRLVGICYANGIDIGAAVIAAGHARDCPAFSDGRYAHLETPEARSSIPRPRYC